jgi:pimeloyl-ACP methyl ester carboxylesterase
MDHLGIREFMVLGFCIGGPFIWNLLQRAGDRVVAAVPAPPSGYRPETPGLSYNNMRGWGPELCARRPDITMEMVDTFLTNMYGGARADFVYTVTRRTVAPIGVIDNFSSCCAARCLCGCRRILACEKPIYASVKGSNPGLRNFVKQRGVRRVGAATDNAVRGERDAKNFCAG